MATFMRNLSKFVLTTTAAAAALLAGTRDAAAYPQFQFSSGTARCAQCHFSPSGGGLINSWGRDESADTISLGGDGAFMHGLVDLPSAIALGLDLRYAVVQNDVGGPEKPELKHFPMQLDVYGRAAFTDAISLNVTVGARGVVRPDDDSAGGRFSSIPDRLVSREHYLMWRPSASGPYVRAGKFQAPYGIRFVEHVYYIRRYTGFNLYEETYNLSGGFLAEDWEVHATAFAHPPTGMPDFFRSVGPRENGGAISGEKRFNSMAALGAQARVGIGKDADRYQAGLVGKLWLDTPKILLLGEADYIRQQVKASQPDFGQNQFVSYLGATAIPIKGLMLGVAYERFQENLSVSKTGRNAVNGQINVFAWAHVELVLLARYQWVGSGSADGQPSTLGMFQLHYYL
jgi:hypothetical protein